MEPKEADDAGFRVQPLTCMLSRGTPLLLHNPALLCGDFSPLSKNPSSLENLGEAHG